MAEGATVGVMKLTPQQVELIRSTFALLEPKSGVAALAFFQRLFALDPRLRALISGDIDAEAEQLMTLLRAATTLADQPRALQAKFARDGSRLFHPSAGQENRAVVGEALLWSLGTTLGREFTTEARVAWAALVAAATENEEGKRASR
jgi:hemoglobin-like flavoprotein